MRKVIKNYDQVTCGIYAIIAKQWPSWNSFFLQNFNELQNLIEEHQNEIRKINIILREQYFFSEENMLVKNLVATGTPNLMNGSQKQKAMKIHNIRLKVFVGQGRILAQIYPLPPKQKVVKIGATPPPPLHTSKLSIPTSTKWTGCL